MTLRLLTLAAIFALSNAALAQTVPAGKGSPADLRGATTVFIDESVRGELREAIVANLRIELPQISIVDRAEDAALIVRFSTTIASDELALDRERSDRTDSAGLSTIPDGPSPRLRFPASGRPEAPDASRNGSVGGDALGSDELRDRTYRYAIGSILKPAGPDRFVEPLSFKRRIGKDSDRAVRDFIRKFAKAYRKANAPAS